MSVESPLEKPRNPNLWDIFHAAVYPAPKLIGIRIEAGFYVGANIRDFRGHNSPRLVSFDEVCEAYLDAKAHCINSLIVHPYDGLVAKKCLPMLQQIRDRICNQIDLKWMNYTQDVAVADKRDKPDDRKANLMRDRQDFAEAIAPYAPRLIESLRHDAVMFGNYHSGNISTLEEIIRCTNGTVPAATLAPATAKSALVQQ